MLANGAFGVLSEAQVFFFFLFFSNPNKKTVLMRFNVIIVGKHLTNDFF